MYTMPVYIRTIYRFTLHPMKLDHPWSCFSVAYLKPRQQAKSNKILGVVFMLTRSLVPYILGVHHLVLVKKIRTGKEKVMPIEHQEKKSKNWWLSATGIQFSTLEVSRRRRRDPISSTLGETKLGRKPCSRAMCKRERTGRDWKLTFSQFHLDKWNKTSSTSKLAEIQWNLFGGRQVSIPSPPKDQAASISSANWEMWWFCSDLTFALFFRLSLKLWKQMCVVVPLFPNCFSSFHVFPLWFGSPSPRRWKQKFYVAVSGVEYIGC